MSTADKPWQLRMFERSLKKQQKVRLLLSMLGPTTSERCLLLTCGDNNGAMNYVFRSAGGQWTWADLEADAIPEIEALLGETVHHIDPAALPFEAAAFDRVVVIDAHEHLPEVAPLNRELARVVAPGGRVIVTTPNGATYLPVAVLKRLLGMTPSQYGHVVQGYTARELETQLESVGLKPAARGAYSRFFTELVEFGINFAYVKLLSRRAGTESEPGHIAPTTSGELKTVGKSYLLYSTIYPVIRAVSALDVLVPGHGGYAVAVAARKPE